jgi:hypothetical protein
MGKGVLLVKVPCDCKYTSLQQMKGLGENFCSWVLFLWLIFRWHCQNKNKNKKLRLL